WTTFRNQARCRSCSTVRSSAPWACRAATARSVRGPPSTPCSRDRRSRRRNSHEVRMKRKNESPPSRRTFLKTAAGVSAGTMLGRQRLWAQGATTTRSLLVVKPAIHQPFLITPKQALDWHVFKAQCGPTYAGSTGWQRYTDFLIAKMPEFGGVDLDYVEIPYDHYIVEDWPDRRTHMHDAPNAVEKLVTDGTPVPVVAGYGMTSGSTPAEGITAP